MDASDDAISFSVMGPLSGDDALHLRILEAEATSIDRGWASRDVQSPYWRFYPTSPAGAELLLPGGERPRLLARQVHFIPAWVTFPCRCTAPMAHLYAHVDLLGLPGTVVRE